MKEMQDKLKKFWFKHDVEIVVGTVISVVFYAGAYYIVNSVSKQAARTVLQSVYRDGVIFHIDHEKIAEDIISAMRLD